MFPVVLSSQGKYATYTVKSYYKETRKETSHGLTFIGGMYVGQCGPCASESVSQHLCVVSRRGVRHDGGRTEQRQRRPGAALARPVPASLAIAIAIAVTIADKGLKSIDRSRHVLEGANALWCRSVHTHMMDIILRSRLEHYIHTYYSSLL